MNTREYIINIARALAVHAAAILIQFCLVIAIFAAFKWEAESSVPFDDSDSPEGRSGLTPRTDHKTGCQYLESKFGGLTPRVDGNGAHVGCRS